MDGRSSEGATHQGHQTTVMLDLTCYDEVISDEGVETTKQNSETLQNLDGIWVGLWNLMDQVEMLSQRLLLEANNVPMSETSEDAHTMARKRNQEVAHLLEGPASLRQTKRSRRLIQWSM